MSPERGARDPVRPLLSNESSSAAAEFGEPVDEKRDEEEGMQCKVCNPEEEESGNRIPRFKREPKDPTSDEIRAHNSSHVPFRSWCPYCVAAAAKASPHKRCEDSRDRSVPGHHVDYWFMRDERGAESIPVLVVKDDMTNVWEHMLLRKRGI